MLFSVSSAFFAFFTVIWTLYFFSIHCWICLLFVFKSCCPIFEEKVSSFVRVGPSLKQWDLVLGLFTAVFTRLTSPHIPQKILGCHRGPNGPLTWPVSQTSKRFLNGRQVLFFFFACPERAFKYKMLPFIVTIIWWKETKRIVLQKFSFMINLFSFECGCVWEVLFSSYSSVMPS